MSGLHQAFDEIVEDVPVYGDLDRAIEQADRERRHRNGVVAALAAAAAVVAVIVGVLGITLHGDNSQQPIGPATPTSTPTSTPTERTSAAAEWPGPIRPAHVAGPTRRSGPGAGPTRGMPQSPGSTSGRSPTDWGQRRLVAVHARREPVARPGPARSSSTASWSIPTAISDADCQVGLNTDAHNAALIYRVWVTNLRTTVTDEQVGPPYGFPIEFRTAERVCRTLPVGSSPSCGTRSAPCGRFGPAATFYLWASLTKDGQVTAWDYAPDEGVAPDAL